MIGWRLAFRDTTSISTQAFIGGDAFTVAGVAIAKSVTVIEAELDVGLNDSTTLGVSYNGQIASDAHDHGFKDDLTVRL